MTGRGAVRAILILWMLAASFRVAAAAELRVPAAPQLTASELTLMAKTVWAEARSDGTAGMLAVAWVILNRTKQPERFAASIHQVVLQPHQFSVWRRGSASRRRMAQVTKSDPSYVLALGACLAALSGTQPDITKGAVHFIHAGMNPRPRWTRGLRQTARVGSHVFFAGGWPKRGIIGGPGR